MSTNDVVGKTRRPKDVYTLSTRGCAHCSNIVFPGCTLDAPVHSGSKFSGAHGLSRPITYHISLWLVQNMRSLFGRFSCLYTQELYVLAGRRRY